MLTDTDLKVILAEGEGLKTEYKTSPDKALPDEACSFANASGGIIIIGVDDHGIVVGTDTANMARSRIQDSLRQIEPSLDIEINVMENLIIIVIPEGKERPYSTPRGFFLRVGPNCQKLGHNEIIAFIQSEGRVRFDELLCKKTDIDRDFDKVAYERFIRLANITGILPHEPMLKNLNCLENRYFTNAGVMFFCRKPEMHIPQMTVICALYKGTGKLWVLDKKDMTGNLMDIIDDTLSFLKKHLKLRYEITSESIRRKDILELPEVALKEAVVNAVCHRDYFEKGANVMVEIFDDRVDITNPGGLPKGLSLDDFGKISLARNPKIADLLNRADYIEKMGTGIQRMRNAMRDAGLPAPIFKTGGFFILSFIRPSDHTTTVIAEGKNEGINEGISGEYYDGLKLTERAILNVISKNRNITAIQLAEQMQCSESTVERAIRSLRQKGIIRREGSKKTGHWIVKYYI